MRSRSSEATRRSLNDIQHHIAMAQGFIAGMSYEAFTDDNLHLYAVTRCLEIISEASRRLPQELKARHKESMWGGPFLTPAQQERPQYGARRANDLTRCRGEAASLLSVIQLIDIRRAANLMI